MANAPLRRQVPRALHAVAPITPLPVLDYEEAPDTSVDLPRGTRQQSTPIGSYELGSAIAEGGMGTIHLGRRRGPGGFSRSFAIKRLRPHLADDPTVVVMLLKEARYAGAIRHGNVVPVLDIVVDGGEVLLVMEYVHGASASQLWKLVRPQPLPVGVAVAIAIGALRGLHAAHEARDERDVPLGLVHRDVSPHNVLVGVDGITRVTDFGIAKALHVGAPATQAGRVKGKLRYLAPEQRLGETVSPRTDLYGVAVVLWEMLTGRRLWDGETDQEIMFRALRERPRPASIFNREVSAGLDAILRRALENDPALRFNTARQMAMALEQLGPVASPTEVGDYVARTARHDLAKLAASLIDDSTDDADAAATQARPAQSFSERARPLPPLTPITASAIRPRARESAPPALPPIPRPPLVPVLSPPVRVANTPAPPAPTYHPASPASFAPPMLFEDPDVMMLARAQRSRRLLVAGAAIGAGAIGLIAVLAALLS